MPLAGVTAVVLDVVRASTTIVAALGGGARAVIPVATPDEARARGRAAGRRAGPGRRRAGRRAAARASITATRPAEYTPERVGGRTVVFTTTNGTRALLALDGAAPGCGRRLRQRGGRRPLGGG